jgi:hypothetical protein
LICTDAVPVRAVCRSQSACPGDLKSAGTQWSGSPSRVSSSSKEPFGASSGSQAARARARDFLDRYPKEAYMSSVERWRELPDGAIEFTMRRLASAD